MMRVRITKCVEIFATIAYFSLVRIVMIVEDIVKLLV